MIKIKEKNMVASLAYAIPGLNSTDRLVFTKRNANADYIIKLVCNGFGIHHEELNRKTRETEICQARQICMFLLRRYTNLSLKAIGEQFNHVAYDHASVIHASKRAIEIMDADEKIRTVVKNIEFQLI